MSKRGKLSTEELEFIKTNAHTMPADEIALRLDRTVLTIEKYIQTVAPPPPTATAEQQERFAISQELRTSEKWKRLQDEFTDSELKFFEEEYVNMMTQFKGDVLHTEVAQVFDAIKLELLKSRNMTARRKAREEIERMERAQELFLAPFQESPASMTEEDRAQAMDLENRLNVARSREQDKTHEWVKLQERVEKIRSALKSNRDQRIKEIQDKGQDFPGVIRSLMHRDEQARKSRDLTLGQMAAEAETQRLGESYQYEDGTYDQPILSADTVAEDD